MKSFLIKLVCVSLSMLLLFSSSTVRAEAQDEIAMAASPAFDIVPMGLTRIELAKRSVTFDLSDNAFAGDYPLVAVKADYTLTNPTLKKESVKIAFPYITQPLGGNLHQLSVKQKNNDVPLEITLSNQVLADDYHKDPGAYKEIATVSNLLKGITQAPFFQEPYGKNRGVVYNITAAPAQNGSAGSTQSPAASNAGSGSSPSAKNDPALLNITVSFDVLSDDTLIISSGYKHMTCRDNTHYTLKAESTAAQLESLGIIALGTGLMNFAVSVNVQEKPEQKWESAFQMDYIPIRDFINSHISSLVSSASLPASSTLSQEHVYSIVVADLSGRIPENRLLFLENSLLSLYKDCLTVSVFEVTLEPNTSETLTFTYPVLAAADRSNSTEPVYRIAYVSDLSGGWADDRNTSFSVQTSTANPYVIQCSYPYSKQSDRRYLSVINAFETDFTFSVYSKSEVLPVRQPTPMENYAAHFIVTGAAAALIAAIVTLFVLHKQRKAKKKLLK